MTLLIEARKLITDESERLPNRMATLIGDENLRVSLALCSSRHHKADFSFALEKSAYCHHILY
jgi:hypothetical protein